MKLCREREIDFGEMRGAEDSVHKRAIKSKYNKI
jgi:phage tail tube protein FII